MYSFIWLCRMMQERTEVVLLGGDNKTYYGTINSIVIDDGSGRSWVVTLALVGGGYKTILVKAE
jgi:hypothetical protein